ncbi:gluconate 2-dehydrogenase subunit 3 family protein [Dasania marina]|uniref:gluconate 2-dehydrogenase subunit 3 family protein n=1 Tax=Dasania marina TaxID=471499 RepID=UPI000475699F|nr:gluconate 2-dehydrogenase subunit 3 family protein [Dasania marina]
MNTTRRNFLKSSTLALSFVVGAKTLLLSPRQAYALSIPLQILSESEATILEVLAEAIVPGARVAGIRHFIDSQLNADVDSSLLMIRYLGVPAPYLGFYTNGLRSSEEQAQARHKKNIAALNITELSPIIDDMAEGNVNNWSGPPASFFFFVLRSDAADVVYGTQEGFDRLDIPYMPHILPEQPW